MSKRPKLTEQKTSKDCVEPEVSLGLPGGPRLEPFNEYMIRKNLPALKENSIVNRPTVKDIAREQSKIFQIPEHFVHCIYDYFYLQETFAKVLSTVLHTKTSPMKENLKHLDVLTNQYKYEFPFGVDIYSCHSSYSMSSELSVFGGKRWKTQIRNVLPDVTKVTSSDGVMFYVWSVSCPSIREDSDIGYVFVSFDKKDKKEVEKFLTQIERLENEITKKHKIISVAGAINSKVQKNWSFDDLVLTEEVKNSVVEDLAAWVRLEYEFKRKNIPYRRGYLFEGPPGNGKTALIRAIISTYDFSLFGFNFSNDDLNEVDLFSMFEDAAKKAPSLIIFEDIDRFFSEDQHVPKAHITKSGFLNCLDGVSVYDGIVIIATANNPEMIDPAIRNRPGRFDVPVLFDNPGFEQRFEYLKKMLGPASEHSVGGAVMAEIAKECEGFSMAFLKLVYEKAAMLSIQRLSKIFICEEDLKSALDQTRRYYKQTQSRDSRSTGFI